MRFRFRMERVLDYLRLRETVKKMEVAHLSQQISDFERRKKEREETLRRVLKESADRFETSANYVPYQIDKINADNREIKLLEHSIVKAQEELEEKKYELGKLAMKRKALENLREKRRQEFRTDENRKEQKRNDELYRLVKGKGL